MTALYIFDIDGTLADNEHRQHFLLEKPKNWKAFFAAVADDKPITPVIATCRSIMLHSEVWFFTGRWDTCRDQTKWWLETHVTYSMLPDEHLVMRRRNDGREDWEVKQEMLDNMLAEDRSRLCGVFDDRQQVVDMWRRNNVQCFRAREGNF